MRGGALLGLVVQRFRLRARLRCCCVKGASFSDACRFCIPFLGGFFLDDDAYKDGNSHPLKAACRRREQDHGKQFEAIVISKTNQVKVGFLPRILEILQKPKYLLPWEVW